MSNTTNAKRPFRIGVWCDYSSLTVAPDQGEVGKFIANMIEGLMQQPEQIELRILVRPGDQHLFSGLAKRFPARVMVLPEKAEQRVKLSEALGEWGAAVLRNLSVKRESIKMRLEVELDRVDVWSRNLSQRPRGQRFSFAIKPMIRLINLCARVKCGLRYCKLGAKAGIAQLFCKSMPRSSFHVNSTAQQVASYAECDVWIVPCGVLKTPLNVPAVVFTHGVIQENHSEEFDPGFVRNINSLTLARTSEATLVACISDFIRPNDLIKQLGAPPEKIRMVSTAGAAPFPRTSEHESERLVGPQLLSRPFVLCPASFGPYSGHHQLVQAVAVLRDDYQIEDFSLVLYGDSNEMPAKLSALAAELGLVDRIHVVGPASRERLGALYRHAMGAIVPTQFEATVFPLYEAIQAACPVACSRIPAIAEQFKSMDDAILYIDPLDPNSFARAIMQIRSNGAAIRENQQEASTEIRKRSWKNSALECLNICHEAAEIHRNENRARPVEKLLPGKTRRRITLLHHIAYAGGVWQATSSIVRSLVLINRERQQLEFVLGVHPEQQGYLELQLELPDLHVEPLPPVIVSKTSLINALPNEATILAEQATDEFFFFGGRNDFLLESDGWFAFVDQFTMPLPPIRPYGILIHDMLRLHLPEVFAGAEWDNMVRRGIRPTTNAATVTVTTTSPTAQDVIEEYQLPSSRCRMIPLAHEPAKKFTSIHPTHVQGLKESFVLNVANVSAHKGAEAMLRGFAEVKKRLGWKDWQLVHTGWGTQWFSKHSMDYPDDRHIKHIRELVHELGLVEGEDVVFLGYTNNSQLMDLFQRSKIVVNAARFDNGSYSMIEGAWFGKPVVSRRYKAAEFLDQRFGIGSHFYEGDSAVGLADALEAARVDLTGNGASQLDRLEQICRDEVSLRKFGERLYDLMVEMANGDEISEIPGESLGDASCIKF
ncbi:glycosyltransferase [Blastopirellula marina]|uniref:Mannosyl transferase n=1 Tax=Blastopirellula marina DSM 3645 TaxID=314230 RepID=A4A140_9BACT|nr:glycosyltransferase [Blastopirellula marina]EAQ77500.1 mannosyl transferase [Blastopirellula marina DSM 3645]